MEQTRDKKEYVYKMIPQLVYLTRAQASDGNSEHVVHLRRKQFFSVKKLHLWLL